MPSVEINRFFPHTFIVTFSSALNDPAVVDATGLVGSAPGWMTLGV